MGLQISMRLGTFLLKIEDICFHEKIEECNRENGKWKEDVNFTF